MHERLLILKDLKHNLQKQFPGSVKNVILFGSQAKDNANENSDYDILIVMSRDYSGKDENQILDICYDMNLKYDIIIDAHIISIGELSTLRGKQPIFVTALNSGIYA